MNILLIGAPGSGKTTTACTGRHPTLLIDVDKKADQMLNIKPLIENGDVTILTPKSPLVADRLAYRAKNPNKGPQKEPQGYYEIVDMLNDILDGVEDYSRYRTIVLDSLTRTVEHLKRLLIYHRAHGKLGKKKDEVDDMNWPSWGSYLSNLEELFNALLYIDDKDFICTVHLKHDIERNEITQSFIDKGYWPMVDGQMREKLGGYFNEVYFCHVEPASTVKKTPQQYLLRTHKTKLYSCARTSMPLDEFEEANLTKIFKKAGIL